MVQSCSNSYTIRVFSSSVWMAAITGNLGMRRGLIELMTIGRIFSWIVAVLQWSDGSKVTLDLPLFPGYLFVHIKRTERVRVLEVPGALAVVGGSGREPIPMPDEAIESLRTGLHLRAVEPHALVTVGQRARIRSGALAGMEGIVVRKKNSLRMVLTLEYIQRSIAVEVSADDLEPLGRGHLTEAAIRNA